MTTNEAAERLRHFVNHWAPPVQVREFGLDATLDWALAAAKAEGAREAMERMDRLQLAVALHVKECGGSDPNATHTRAILAAAKARPPDEEATR